MINEVRPHGNFPLCFFLFEFMCFSYVVSTCTFSMFLHFETFEFLVSPHFASLYVYFGVCTTTTSNLKSTSPNCHMVIAFLPHKSQRKRLNLIDLKSQRHAYMAFSCESYHFFPTLHGCTELLRAYLIEL